MAQVRDNKSKDQIGSKQKSEFLAIMDSLFPDQDLLNVSSKFRKKADFTFELMQKQNWNQEEFEKTMLEFSMKWVYNSWMPANVLEFKKKLFADNDMVI
ncbi:MAG: hypothetical protein KIT33_07895 [Candidatus Kapabacteria bacterium]|jgi:hypothetical protein|nr:hypothetical protein [Ignavibacteriota bacterium]MCW5884876.1 hypothetical protein [Candidatus Kapabacteria bacterium]